MATAKSPLRTDILKLKVERDDGVYSVANYQLSESIGYLLKRSTLMMSGAVDQELTPYDLTHPQFSILMMLKERNCNTAADIARETCNDTGAVTRMLDRLEAKDIVRRVRSVEDRRIVNIELTDLGKLVIDKMPVVAINVMNRYLQGFSSEEVAQFKYLLRKLMQQGGEDVAAAAPKEKAAAAKEKKA